MSTQSLIAGRYELRDVIGEGGMGTVYRSVDTRTRRPVAVKQLKADVIKAQPGIIDRFRREGQVLRRLNHPNIVRVLGVVEENDAHYIIMEYVSGGSLSDLINSGQTIPIERVLSIALELSDALSRAHHLKVIHRDIKPANVLLASDGTPRLTDFGLAFMHDRSRLTKQQTVMGTLSYMSPEALNGKSLDGRTDIWAFAILIYEMLTGDTPFDEDTAGATINAIFNKTLPNLTDLRPDTPPALQALLNRMLARDIEERIGSIRLVGAELYAMLQGKKSLVDALNAMPTPQLPAGAAAQNIQVTQGLISELFALVQDWEGQAQQSREQLERLKENDLAASMYHRARVQILDDVVDKLRERLEETEGTMLRPAEVNYAPVSRRDVERLFRKAKVKYNDLYEDQGFIFTAIFPSLLQSSLEKRVDALRTLAPSLVIIDEGMLDQSREAYIDFAFDAPF